MALSPELFKESKEMSRIKHPFAPQSNPAADALAFLSASFALILIAMVAVHVHHETAVCSELRSEIQSLQEAVTLDQQTFDRAGLVAELQSELDHSKYDYAALDCS